ncbi:hypothetical protein FEM48_Zijuj03G0080800 [Ziziphus jujuba var. spinosa]|uniref:Uncharacterized protein n=1 Tax=Ziziphus jujuba var. spinosa TaxID=714518 RepID=A0A978VP52_ZIZJJ|nr:hypothetical protein FEM48_Zijuj03G0080800 [Ziziphus jujuba var. spinosa]
MVLGGRMTKSLAATTATSRRLTVIEVVDKARSQDIIQAGDCILNVPCHVIGLDPDINTFLNGEVSYDAKLAIVILVEKILGWKYEIGSGFSIVKVASAPKRFTFNRVRMLFSFSDEHTDIYWLSSVLWSCNAYCALFCV